MPKRSPPSSGQSTPSKATALLQELRERKFRITKVREAVIELLCESLQPLSAPELLGALGQRSLPVNKTTVYRELDFLVDNKVVSEIDILDGTKRYEVVPPDHHHHHLVCTECGKIQCVEMEHDLDAIERKIQRSYKFRIDSHVLEFFGRCASCV